MLNVEQRQRLQSRIRILRTVVILLFALLTGAFWVFQVLQHSTYETLAENNHQRTLALRAPRGAIYDRNGLSLIHI